jgi:predicted aconitase
MGVELEERDRALLEGEGGEGAALAMRLVVKMAEVARAPRLRDVTQAHIDSCLYHGQAGLDFAERLLAGGAAVAVPSTLNVSALDLLHPELVALDDDTRSRAKRLMDAYVELGCRPTWTCAPYQLPDRPALGEHIAWAESNAIVFANSVLGARTNRYGDFIDVCAAITGRVPDCGLHTDAGRRATLLVRLEGVSDELLDAELLYPVLGHLLGRSAGSEVAAIEGLPNGTSEDRLKALGAAAASSGAVALFHAIGRTPEAPDRESVIAGGAREVIVTRADLRAARDQLSPVQEGAEIGAVSVGTPHASETELRRLAALVRDERPRVPFYVNTGRGQLAAVGSVADDLADAGVTVVTDTCTYITPVMRGITGPVMTDSGKWAWYAPSNLGYEVALGSMQECARSAAAGFVIRDGALWSDR